MKFALWYDNGSGYYEADPCGLIEAASAEEALRVTGGSLTTWGTQRIATAGWDQNPNQGGRILDTSPWGEAKND